MADERSPQTAGQSGSRTALRSVLFVVLILLILGLLHDRFRARPQWEAAYEAIEQRNTEINASPESPAMDTAMLQSIVGFAPSDTGPHPDDDQLVVETYAWRRGLPWLSYKLLAVYKNGRFLYHCKTALPTKEEPEPALPADQAPDPKAPRGPSAAGASPQGETRAPLDFAKLDANGDGKLTAEELAGLPEQRRTRLMKAADTNADGAISKEEFDKRPRPGGKGPGGEGQKPAVGGQEKPEEAAQPAEQQKPADQPPADKPAAEKPAQDKPAEPQPTEKPKT